jgi:hypothetical protein
MTLTDVADTLLLLVGAFDANDHDQVGKLTAVLMSQWVQRPCKANVTRLRACMMEKLVEQDLLTMEDVWSSFCDWLKAEEELSAWVPFCALHLPLVETKVPSQVPALAGGARTGHTSYQPPRYTVKFDLYDGKQGACALWWRNEELTMDTMKIPDSERYVIFQSLLKGAARVEHTLHLDQLRRDGELSTSDVKIFVARLVKKFDAGQHEVLLKQLNWVKQTRAEDFFAF